jgi:hypothetical protein
LHLSLVAAVDTRDQCIVRSDHFRAPLIHRIDNQSNMAS